MDPENISKFKHREKGPFKKKKTTQSFSDLWGDIKQSMCIHKCQKKKGVGQNIHLKK